MCENVNNYFDEMFEQIRQAKKEAIKHNIKANAIVINDKLQFSKARFITFKYSPTTYNEIVKIPPMILGLRTIFSDELPDGVDFAILHNDSILSQKEEIEKLKQENEELREKLKHIEDILGGRIWR